MDEVDNIIIHSLRRIGCDIEENITNLSSFNAKLVVDTVVKCLKTIDPMLKLPSDLSPNTAERIRVGASLAEKIKKLSYNGTIGYQTFLYPSDTELRRLLLFLIEKFPKEDKVEIKETEDKSVKKISLLEKSVASALSVSLAEPWLPHYCHKQEFKFTGYTKVPYNSIRLDVPSSLEKDEDYKNYYKDYQKSIAEQVKITENILPSIISYNVELLHSIKLLHPTNIIDQLDWISSQHQHKNSVADDLSFSSNTLHDITTPKSDEVLSSKESELKHLIKSATDGEKLIKREQTSESEIERISSECENLRLSIEEEQNEVEKLNAKLSQITLIHQNEQQELTVLEDQKKMIARSYDLLNDGETNIEELERIIETKRCKLINLATEWEESRKPLIQKYRDHKENNSNRTKIDEIRLLKEKQRDLNRELKNKEKQYVQLMSEIQKVSKDTNRSAYTQRILEIINNIRKQKDEIEKVIDDTRNIKKEINILTGRLERSYEVVKTLVSQYHIDKSLLYQLHLDFNSLIKSVEKTGEIIRKIRDLEEEIDTKSAKNVEANLERITADLLQMQQEAAILTDQLKM